MCLCVGGDGWGSHTWRKAAAETTAARPLPNLGGCMSKAVGTSFECRCLVVLVVLWAGQVGARRMLV